jgi:hypothetical protein
MLITLATDVSGQAIGPISKGEFLDYLNLQNGPIGGPETSVTKLSTYLRRVTFEKNEGLCMSFFLGGKCCCAVELIR